MKRALLFIVALFVFAYSVMAEPVDPDQALQIAKQFVPQTSKGKKVQKKGETPETSTIVYTHKMPKSNRAAFYIVNVGDGSFVLVSADDVAHQILGYSFDKSFPIAEDGTVQLPPHIKGFFDDLAAQIEAAIEKEPNRAVDTDWTQPKAVVSRRSPSNLPDSVGPLLTTTWDQGQYYNALCPADANGPDGHVLTGCVATAMAQIIKYWGYPVHGRGTHCYETNYGTLSVDYEKSNYDYSNMPDMLTSESSETQVNAIAKLMYDCGTAANMSYGPYASGSREENVRSALINYFGFTSSLGYAQKWLYSDKEWEDSLKANIVRGEPIVYFGGNIQNAHSFILDGYNKNGYFHFNFGWGGDCDGWYLTKAINAGVGLTEWQSAIMGIRPDNNSYSIICQKVTVSKHDNYIVKGPMDLYSLRGGSKYLAVNELTGVRYNLNLVPEDSLGQLVLDVLRFDNEQSVAIYDGINNDSLIRVIETRNLDDFSTTTFRNWFYEGLPSDTIFQNMASQDFSPVISTHHGFTIVVYSYGGMKEGFHLQVRNVTDITPEDTPTISSKKYWTDVVKSEPEGYLLDGDTIRITTPEGLAWVAHCVDSMYINNVYYQYSHHVISIEKDLNLAGLYWVPIRSWFGNVDGHGHEIANIEVNTVKGGGLFSMLFNAEISNIGLQNAKINAISSAGSLAGSVHDCQIINCYSVNHIVNSGNSPSGGLIGYDNNGSQIVNCYAYGEVNSQIGWGGLLGICNNSDIQNCVTRLGELFCWNTSSWAGLIAEEVHSGTFSNCFSDISLAKRNWYSDDPEYLALAKRAYFLGNVYNVDAIDNLAAFNIATDNMGMLIGDTAVNYTLGENMDVVTALNNKVSDYNSSKYRTWVRDSETNLPVFGDYYVVTCPNVSNITAENIPYNGEFAVALSWQENGNAVEWQVKYNLLNAPDVDAKIINANATQAIIEGLQLGSDYVFYVRPLVNGVATIGWGQALTFNVDKTLWIDMVTECPEGYVEDSEGNVTIFSPEGLAWLAKNGFNYRQDTIYIASDLDMGVYKWTPIGRYEFRGVVEGNNHTISNLYCREKITIDDSDTENIGLFGHAVNATFNNIVIENCDFSGHQYIGSLFGSSEGTIVNNCHAKNTLVKGMYSVGGLGGRQWISQERTGYVFNCSSSGEIFGNQTVGGLFANVSENMSNCYSSCNVKPLGMSNERSFDVARGGLCGSLRGAISNCFNIGVVSYDEGDRHYGLSIGSAYMNSDIRYVYSCPYDNIPFVGMIYNDNGDELLNANISSNTSLFTNNSLDTPVLISGVSYTDLLSALNAWVDANNSEGQYRHWVADTENKNGGYPIFAPMYTLTYKVDGDIFKTRLFEPGTILTPESEPTKDGYVFGGWSGLPDTMPDHDVEVTALFYLYGDVNTDSKVNVVDVVDIARYVVETPSENFRAKLADLNKDLAVNIADAVVLVSCIAGEQNFARAMEPSKTYNYDLCQLQLQSIQENALSLCLDGDADFTAFQFDVELPQGVDITAMRINGQRKDGHQLLYNKVAENRYRVAALSLSNAVFKGSEGELLNITLEGTGSDDICIRDIHFITTNGTDIRFDNLQSNSIVTGIKDYSHHEKEEIYDLQGRRLSKVQRGVNIVNGNKVVIK